MVRKDWTKYLIPRRLQNISRLGRGSEFDTVDRVWIDDIESYEEMDSIRDMPSESEKNRYGTQNRYLHKTLGTDFVVLNGTGVKKDNEKGQNYVKVRLRSNTTNNGYSTDCIRDDGRVDDWDTIGSGLSYAPSVCLAIDSDEEYDIYENKQGNYILRIGEYINSKSDNNISNKLERMYNGGNLLEGLECTGRWYSSNGEREYGRCAYNILKHSPEFEYAGKRYVRFVSNMDEDEDKKYLSDGSQAPEKMKVVWMNVEPIEMVIRNWSNLVRTINPMGENKDNYFYLTSDKAIVPGICFYPDYNENENKTLWQNSTPRGFFNGIDVRNIQENGNPEYSLPNGGDYSDGCSFIEEAFHLDRDPMIEYAIPEWQKQIPDDCFNGCVSLKKLVIHSGVNGIGRRAFEGLKFRWFYRDDNGNAVLAQELPKDKEIDGIDLNDAVKSLPGFDYGLLITGIEKEKTEILRLAKFLSKKNISIPYSYAKELIREGEIKCITENTDFRFFRKEFKDINNQLMEFSEEERNYFYSFAYTLGCFSDKKVLDENGNETDVFVAQKACSALARFLKISERTKLGGYKKLLELHKHDHYGSDEGVLLSLPLTFEPNQDFLNLVTEQNGNIIKKLIDLEDEYPGIFVTVLMNFDDMKAKKKVIDNKDHVKSDSWENTFKRTYAKNVFEDVEPGTEDIAELLGMLGLTQEMYEKVCELRREGEEHGMPHHLLGRELKEDVIYEEIEALRRNGAEALGESVVLLDELYKKKFSYEWLDKYSPVNGIIGMFVDCCAVAINKWNGPAVVRATMTKHDVQNLILRDTNGELMGKVAVYINKDLGYMVLNDPFVDKFYVEGAGKTEENKKAIVESFSRGLQDFIHEYDEQNPEAPIQQVNAAKNYLMDIKLNIFEKAEERLEVPEEYGFREAMINRDQYVIYRRDASKNKGVRRDDRNEDER